MKRFKEEIDNLFTSLGFFPDEYTLFLDGLPMDDQLEFITDLYKRISSKQHISQLQNENFAVKNINGKPNYHYSVEDLETARKTEILQSERILKSEGVSDEDCLKFRATKVFHDRKFNEIRFASSEIKDLYGSIVSRVQITSSIDEFIDRESIYKDFAFQFIEFPVDFDAKKLNLFLSDNDFQSCFMNTDHFKYFKINTFKLLTNSNRPLLLNLPLTKESKKVIPKKMYLISLVSDKDTKIIKSTSQGQ
ncbi:MAG: hypothetical protein PSN34_09080 [Urechidicola sp.]|nr:hypothetical protein [Urechidicola sp.]